MRNESFVCDYCKKQVSKHPQGGVRNHCLFCLYSKHFDENFPGDRKSLCAGLMKPIGIDNKKNKGWMIQHKCLQCGKEILNKIADDDRFIDWIKQRNN